MVSVIMPVYNGEKFLKEAINSVLSQTYKDLELIIINDGSTDKTSEIISSFNDERIKYYYQENKGQASARNLGIDKSTGEYLAFIDADDIYKNNKLEKQVEVLKNDLSYGVVYNNIEIIDEDNKVISEIKSELIFKSKEDFLAYSLFRQVIPSPASMLVRREHLASIRYPVEYRNTEDYKFILDLASKTKFYSINESLYLYRRHSCNVTSSHLKQVGAEKDIVKSFGEKFIRNAVEKSSFKEIEKRKLLAKIFIKIDFFEEAEKILNEVSDKESYIYFYLGNLSYIKNEFRLAKEYYEKAISKDGSLAEVFNNLGVVKILLGNAISGREDLLNALSLNSIYMDAKHNLSCKNINSLKLTTRELRKYLTVYNSEK